jgi:hypothetical protein
MGFVLLFLGYLLFLFSGWLLVGSLSQVLLNSAEIKVAWAKEHIKWFMQQFHAQVAKPLPSGLRGMMEPGFLQWSHDNRSGWFTRMVIRRMVKTFLTPSPLHFIFPMQILGSSPPASGG